MFLKTLVRRNRPFIEAAINLHQVGEIPANSYVGADPDAALSNVVKATLPPPAAIDYYGTLDPNEGQPIRAGDSVIFGFRAQAFVTRAYVVPIAGVSKGEPTVEGVWIPYGQRAEWPSW